MFRVLGVPAVLLLTLPAMAQEGIEKFHVELTASGWLVSPSGTIQSGITPVDLRRDLQLEQWKPHFFGKLVVKPCRRHRLMVEGTPYRLSGAAPVSRQIVFAGRTYNIQDFVTSTAD